MPKKIIHHKPHENVREKNDTRDGTKQKMLHLKNTSFDQHMTIKTLDKQTLDKKAIDDQPIDNSYVAIIPGMTDLHSTGSGLLMEQEDLLAGLHNAHNTETDLLPEDETATAREATDPINIDDVLSPAESDLLHALEGNSSDADENNHDTDPLPELSKALKDSGNGDYSSIQDLLDAGMDLDINH